MVEISEINDRESLKGWLEALPQGTEVAQAEARRVAVSIAARAAARALPLYWHWVLISERARERDMTALPVLRSVLISAVEALVPTADIREAANAAADAANAWDSLRRDCTVLAEGRDVFAEPLWVAGNPFAEAWANIQAEVAKADHDWGFWVAWYAQMLDPQGRAPNWQMLERIALIPAKVWDGPVDRALAAINGIWEQYQLRDEALALKGELGAVDSQIAPVHRKSHNNPPELLDAPEPVQRAVTTLGQSLDDAVEELSEPEPDKARLVRIATELLAALKVIAGYCGKVADAAVMASAKATGAGGGAYIVDLYLLNGRLLEFATRLLTIHLKDLSHRLPAG